MKKIFTLFFLTVMFPSLRAQISEGGTPFSFKNEFMLKKELPSAEMKPFDLEAIKAEDHINDLRKDIPWRFGYNFPVNLTLKNSGIWETVGKGDRLWRLKISSKNALSLNIIFGEYVIPQGGKVFLYNEEKTHILGAFTEKNNLPHRKLGVDLIPGDLIIVEYFEPYNVAGQGILSIEQVTHGYRGTPGATKDYGDSGPCNNNVICPEGAPWQDQIRATAMNLVNGNTWCSGSMINNTCQDGTPYYLTADHCLSGSVATWVFRFNYESPNCSPSTDGPYSFTVSGATLRANNGASDFALLELSSTPPDSFNVFYAGWDRTGTIPQNQVGIHHPAGDVKKISFDDDPAVDTVNYGKIVWQIKSWNDGTTEGGSSGSPLFDQNKRLIGQLYGGTASCSSITDDNYGKFNSSWDLGGNATNQLKDWLDMCNTNQVTLDGLDPYLSSNANDAATQSVGGINPIYCDYNLEPVTPFAVIANKGLDTLIKVTVLYGLDGNMDSVFWTGSLATNAKDTIFFSPFLPPAGDHSFSVTVKNPNDSVDQGILNDTKTIAFKYIANSQPVVFTLQTDNYGSEISWQIKDSLGTILYSGAGFEDIFGGELMVDSLCLPAGCYDFIINDSYGDGLNYGSPGTYFFQNVDGDTLASIITVDFGSQETNTFCVEGSAAFISILSPLNCASDCNGQLQAQMSGTEPFIYLWSSNAGGQTTQVATGLCEGTYNVTISDSLNQQHSASIFLAAPAPLTVSLSGIDTDPGTCIGSATAAVSGGTTPWTYAWSNGQVTPSITGLCRDTFSVTVTDVKNCTAIDTIIILTTGISQKNGKPEILILPNPNNGNFLVISNLPGIKKIEGYNILGERIFIQQNESGSKQISVELTSGIPHGMYFIKVEGGDFYVIEKMFIATHY